MFKFLSHFLAPQAFASGTLTVSDDFDDTETCTIGAKVYTFQASLTNVDGNVKIGANVTATMLNFKNAINLTGVAGTDYATLMTEHPAVVAISSNATTLVVRAKVNGTIGNHIATSETGGEHAWGAAFLAGGTGDGVALLRTAITPHRGINSGVRQVLLNYLDPQGDE
jgi:hypothetical protein